MPQVAITLRNLSQKLPLLCAAITPKGTPTQMDTINALIPTPADTGNFEDIISITVRPL